MSQKPNAAFILIANSSQINLTREEIAEIVLLDTPYIGDDPPSKINGFLTSAHRMLICKIDKKIVGKVEFEREEKNGSMECIIDWFCAPGHGKLLLDRFEKIMVEQNVQTIRLICALDESESKATCARRVNFYMSNGYRVENIRYCMHPSYDDGTLMVAVKLNLSKKLF